MRVERRLSGRVPSLDIPSDQVADVAGLVGGGAFIPGLLRRSEPR